jgi:adenylate cyclase
VGLHTDSVVVGVIGSNERVSYTALGDGVNIAARLQTVNKAYDTTICVSGTIHTEVANLFVMRPLDYVAVKGRKQPILIFELMGAVAEKSEVAATAAQKELARLTSTAFDAWRANDLEEAKQLYSALLEQFPDDAVAQLYVSRCEQGLTLAAVPGRLPH